MTAGVRTPDRHPSPYPGGGEVPALSGLTGTSLVLPFVTDPVGARDGAGVPAPSIAASAQVPAAAGQLADRLGTRPAAVVVAAHLRGLGLLGSEAEVSVVLGPAIGGVDPVPIVFGLSTDWTALIAETAAAQRIHAPTDPTLIRSEGLQLVVDDDRFTVTMLASLRDAAGVNAHLDRIRIAIDAAAADPTATVSAADLLTRDEHLTNARLGTGEILEPLPYHLFAALEQRASEHPERTAVIHRDARVSYGVLITAVHTVHRAIDAAGIRPGQVVAVALERGPLWIAVTLGILRAGAVYLPLDPRDPIERRERLVRRSAAQLVIDRPQTLGLLGSADRIVLAQDSATAPVPAVRRPDPLDPAYVYFTSGSTGEPKGALCGHGGMDNHLLAKIRDFRITDTDVVLQSAQTTFDISLWQFAAPLMVGATVVVADHAALLDVPAALRLLAQHDVSIVQVVPSYLAILLDHLQTAGATLALRTLRCLSVTGEAISMPIARRLFEMLPGITLINAYGATEASDDTTHEIMRHVPDGPSVPVGRPNINVVVHVLDEHDREVPPGSIGEIAFSGIMVGLGYLNDPQRTAEAFCPDPVLPGARLYRSGDYGRWLPGGSLQFHGRRDEQVKIAGIRLELGEIEFRLRSLPDVGEAAVVTVASGEAKELAGFVTGARQLDLAAADAELRLTLPAAAVPTTLVQLEALPLTENGKVDKRALARIAAAHLDRRGPHDAAPAAAPTVEGPVSPATRVRSAWASALELPAESLPRNGDFFALGGTSIRALRAVAAADQLFGIADLFTRPVLGDLLALVESRQPPLGSDGFAGTGRSAGAAPVVAELSLLLQLTAPADPLAHLVFLPPAGASALIAREFADAVARQHPRVRVSALQHPGQDLPADAALPTGATLAEQVAGSLAAEPTLPIVLWGQGSGAATALALARRCELTIDSVLLASQPARDRRGVLRGNAALAATADSELAERAANALGADLGALSAQDRDRLARLYRHEMMQSQLDLLDDGLGIRDAPASTALSVPLVLLRALDDPVAVPADPAWPGATELTVVDGGALFCRTRPELAAALLTHRAAAVTDR